MTTENSGHHTHKKPFIYGTHYWRPPNPPRDQHRYHLTKIKNELGFNLVKFRLLWNWHHRLENKFDFAEVHEMFDICDEIGLNVLVELNLESAPYWLEAQHPETRYVNANGRAVELGAQEATPAGGHPGLCFHNPIVMHHAERYVREMVRQFKDRKSLHIYDCWNEPHLEPVWCNNMWGNKGDRVYCYCSTSRLAFRNWLQKRYGDIDTFNRTWGRAYTTFDHVSPPILNGHYADWLDWLRFWFEELHDYMAWRVKVIKEEDPSRMVISHSGAVPPVLPRAHACIDNFKFAEPVDIWGTSFAPQAFSWDLATCAQVLELTRAAARGKPFWISEMPGGPGNLQGFRASRIPRPKDYHLWNWLSAALGSVGTMHWCYLSERTGQEAGNYGMIRGNGQQTPRSLAIADVAKKLIEYEDVLTTAQVPTQVAMLYSSDNSSLLFAMELDDKLYGQSHTGYYRAVWKADMNVRYVTYDTLDDIKENVLIVPMALTLSDEVADKLAKFVYNGGILFADCRTGLYDERGWMRPDLPAGKLREAAGVTEGEQVCSDPENDVVVPAPDGGIDSRNRTDLPQMDPIHKGPPITFSWPIPATVQVHGFLTPLELHGAEPIGKSGDMVLATKHHYGKGCVYYFGTYLGLALDKNLPDAHALLQHLLLKHAKPVLRGNQLRPRLIVGQNRSLLAVFNDHRTQAITETVSLPPGVRQAKNAVDGTVYPIGQGTLSVTVPAENVLVLVLEK
jgi:beta-galactosidase